MTDLIAFRKESTGTRNDLSNHPCIQSMRHLSTFDHRTSSIAWPALCRTPRSFCSCAIRLNGPTVRGIIGFSLPTGKYPSPTRGSTTISRLNWTSTNKTGFKRASMLARGFYVVHIANLYRYYQPDQVYLGYSTHLNDDQDGELAKLFAFLGLQNYPIPRTVSHARSYEAPMREVTRNLLREIYRPFDEQLAKLLGAQPPWMDE